MKIYPSTIYEARDLVRRRVVGRVEAVPSPQGESDHRHWYSIRGNAPGLSVTQKHGVISKPHLYKWYAKKALEKFESFLPVLGPENREELIKKSILAGEEVRDDAGDVGSAGHDAVDKYLNVWIKRDVRYSKITDLLPSDADPRSIAFVRSIGKFFDDHPKYAPVCSEIRVGVPATKTRPMIVGTLDVVLWNHDTSEVEVWDWKSSNNVSDDYAMQVAAYRFCFERMTRIQTAGFCGIVKGSKWSDKYSVFFVKDPDRALQAHLNASRLYDYFEDGSEKLVPDKVIIQA